MVDADMLQLRLRGDFRSHHAEELEVFTDGRQNDVDLAHISLTWHMKVLSDFHFVNSEYYNGDDDHGAMKSWRRSAPLGTRQSFWRTLWSGVRKFLLFCQTPSLFSVVLVVDWIDEMVEFINLAFAAVLEPIIGAILNGQDIDIFT